MRRIFLLMQRTNRPPTKLSWFLPPAGFKPKSAKELQTAVDDCVAYHKPADGDHDCNVEVEIEACKSWCVEKPLF